MALNTIEVATLALWALGVAAGLRAVSRPDAGARAWIVLLAAVFVPLVGALVALVYLAVTARSAPSEP